MAPEESRDLATAMSELADLRQRMERLEAGIKIAAGALFTSSTVCDELDEHEAAVIPFALLGG